MTSSTQNVEIELNTSGNGSTPAKTKSKRSAVPPPCAPFCSAACEPIKVRKLHIIFNPFGGKKRGKKTIET
eukprot:1561189-Prymnesium_polylepis.1